MHADGAKSAAVIINALASQLARIMFVWQLPYLTAFDLSERVIDMDV